MVKGNKFKPKEGEQKLAKLDGVKKPEVAYICDKWLVVVKLCGKFREERFEMMSR